MTTDNNAYLYVIAAPSGAGKTTLVKALVGIDRIKLVKPEMGQMVKGEDGLFRLKGGEPMDPDAGIRLVSGALEGSNVNTVEAMVKMIALARQFEMQVKMMRTAEEDAAAAAQMMRMA